MYPAILEHRIPYDIDGSEVGTRFTDGVTVQQSFALGVDSWLASGDKVNLNQVQTAQNWPIGVYAGAERRTFWFFFPEQREITAIGFYFKESSKEMDLGEETVIQGSNDTTNGMDGTWETATWNPQPIRKDLDYWRSQIAAVSFSTSYKTIRIGLQGSDSYHYSAYLHTVHLYGQKAASEQPDDIIFCDTAGNELTALMDWGDRPEGTTLIQAIKVKNASASKIANNVNLQLNHEDFTLSWSADGPWQSVLDIASIGPNSLSSTVYIRNHLLPPLLTLGAKAARIIATVGSWS